MVNFQKQLKNFPKWFYCVTFSSVCEHSGCSTSSQTLRTSVFFIWVVLMSVQSYLTEIYIYLMTNNVEHIFISLLVIPLWSVWVFCFRFTWVVLLSKSSLYIYWIQILYQIYVLQIPSPILWLNGVFHILNSIFQREKV